VKARGFHWSRSNGISLLVPDFFAPFGLVGGYSTRCAEDGRPLDIDLRGGKDADQVLANRRLVTDAVGVEADDVVFAQQVHGCGVALVTSAQRGRGARRHADSIPAVDGLATSSSGLPLAVMAADCPILLMSGEEGAAVAAVHSGRRGTLVDIAAAALSMLCELSVPPGDVYASIGPAIGPCCYEVGEKVRRDFETAFPWAGDLFRISAGRLFFDLPGALKRQLVDAGVSPGRIFDCGLCTVCHGDLFYSYRREGGAAGRTAGIIAIAGRTPERSTA